MDSLLVIMVAASLVYGCRVAGFTLNLSGASAARDRVLHFIPLAVLPALITQSILHGGESIPVKAAVLMMAGFVMWGMKRRALNKQARLTVLNETAVDAEMTAMRQ